MTDFEWFRFHCDRSTFSVTINQPAADRILAVIEAAVRVRAELALKPHPTDAEVYLAGAVDDITKHTPPESEPGK